MTRHRMAWLAALLTILGGCDSSGPSNDAPPVGRYRLTVDVPGGASSGAMVLDYASADSIGGHFELPGYRTEMQLGFFNVDAWSVATQGEDFAGVLFLRFQRDGDTGLRCVDARRSDSEGPHPGSCTAALE